MAAQQDTTTTVSQNEFRPVEGGEKTTDVGLFFGLAYCAFWVLIFGFIAAAWRRQQALAVRLDRIEANLRDKG